MVRLLLFVRLLLYRCDRAWVSIIRCPIRNQIAFCAQRITIIASTRHSRSADRNNGIRKNTWRQRVVLVTYQLEKLGKRSKHYTVHDVEMFMGIANRFRFGLYVSRLFKRRTAEWFDKFSIDDRCFLNRACVYCIYIFKLVVNVPFTIRTLCYVVALSELIFNCNRGETRVIHENFLRKSLQVFLPMLTD